MLRTLLLSTLAAACALAGEAVNFDRGWRFHLGDVPGAEQTAFADSAWRALDLPHDWAIEQPFDKEVRGHEDTGYLPGGTGWYRKTFTLPAGTAGKHLALRFDGVYMDSTVWVDGQKVGNRPYGYSTFRVDLNLAPAAEHVVAVRVNVVQPCSRWYPGAGIYRHVWLETADPVRVAPWGVQVTTPKVDAAEATVRIRTRLAEDGKAPGALSLRTRVLDPAGTEVASLEAAGAGPFDQQVRIPAPRRWSPETPELYEAVTEVLVQGKVVDRETTPFGIRSIAFGPEGFLLNGAKVRIKGVCDHHDLGCLGAGVSRTGLERQLDILRAMGCNAIRTSHNPPAPELLELCDRKGFLVMDEAFDEWKIPKRRKGYARFFDAWSERDLADMIHRDFNHPCIILWSIGNEIEEQMKNTGAELSRRLADICHREDPTRPVVAACHMPKEAVQTGYAANLDVFGINYNIEHYQLQKGKVLIASETASALSTRGEYGLGLKDGKVAITVRPGNQCTSYDLDRPEWGHTAETSLMALRDAPWVAGEFVWTGFDYLGEPTPYEWPSRSSYFGICDLCGFPKDRYYLYQSQWTERPMAHLLPHWTWPGLEGREIPVWCFTNADSAELFLNGVSQGVRLAKDRAGLHFAWQVPYAPGTLKVVARRQGAVVAEDEVRTAGAPAALVLKPDRTRIQAGGADLAFVQVQVVDRDGNLCPDAADRIRFTLAGPARLAGTDNGDPTCHASFQDPLHPAFHGLALAVVKAGAAGDTLLTASADGLKPASVTLTTLPEVQP